jgi:hypothetical protein
MKSFKGYVQENFKELVKISCAVDPKNSAKFEGLLKKENFGYNGPMDQSRYDRLGLDEFIIVGPNTPVMKWVSKNKSMIIKLAKLPMPKITFASVDVNQHGGDLLQEKFLQDLLTPNEFKRELEQEIEDAGYSPKVIKKITKKGKGYEVRVASYIGSLRDIFTNMGASKINFKKGGGVNIIMVEAIDHPAYINVILQDFAKHMKRIKPHAKKAGTKLTVQGKDVRVDGLATAIKKMFDFMTSDGKGFYE